MIPDGSCPSSARLPDLKPGEGVEPERHDVAQCPARLKPPDHVDEDSGNVRGALPESAPAILGWPQLTFAVEMNGQHRGTEPVHGRS
jgi:hypothetical protein